MPDSCSLVYKTLILNFEALAGDSEESLEIVQRCQELLHQPKAGEQVASVWGCGAGLVLEETRSAMSRILKVCFCPVFPGATSRPRCAISHDRSAASGARQDTR